MKINTQASNYVNFTSVKINKNNTNHHLTFPTKMDEEEVLKDKGFEVSYHSDLDINSDQRDPSYNNYILISHSDKDKERKLKDLFADTIKMNASSSYPYKSVELSGDSAGGNTSRRNLLTRQIDELF